MVARTGAGTIAGYQINPAATVYGTAIALGTDDQLAARITNTTSVTDNRANPVGTGKGMDTDATLGNISPAVGIEMEGGYENGMDQIMAQYFGTATAAAEENLGEGDFLHRFTTNTTFNANYGTLAYETSSTTTIELPSAATQSISISLSDITNFLTFGADILGNKLELSTAVNDNAQLATTTVADEEKIIAGFDDAFLLNDETGIALVNPTDCVAITDLSFSYTKPQEFVGEIKCTAGNGEPIATDLIVGTLSVTLKQLDDHTYLDLWEAETTSKMLLEIQGNQINSGENKTFRLYIPKAKFIQVPEYSVVNTGINPHVLNFDILAASATPAGMFDTLPHVEFINTRATDYIT